jgi:hypothetical protein
MRRARASSVESVRGGNVSSAKEMKASNSCSDTTPPLTITRPLRRHRATARKAWITPATSLLKMAKRENQLQLIRRRRPN